MTDLIRRSDAENIFRNARKHLKPENYSGQEFFIRDNILLNAEQIVHSIPAVDAVEVRHGRWLVTDAYPHNVYCSECYKTYVQDHWQIWQDKPGDGGIERNYCPHCGARMDGRREDGDA